MTRGRFAVRWRRRQWDDTLAKRAKQLAWLAIMLWLGGGIAWGFLDMRRETLEYLDATQARGDQLTRTLVGDVALAMARLRGNASLIARHATVAEVLPFVDYVTDSRTPEEWIRRRNALRARDDLRQLTEQLAAMAADLALDHIAILHLSGEVIASSSSNDLNLIARSWRNDTLYKRSATADNPSDIVVKPDGTPTFRFGANVLVADQRLGVAVVEQSGTALARPFTQLGHPVMITDSAGVVVAAHNPAHQLRYIPEAGSLDGEPDALPLRYGGHAIPLLLARAPERVGRHSLTHGIIEGVPSLRVSRPIESGDQSLLLHVFLPLEELPQIERGAILRDALLVVAGLLLILIIERSAAFAFTMRERNAALVEANQRVSETMKQRSLFFARMSHEIRTPMNGVIGMLEQLALGTLTADQTAMVATARRAAEGLMVIIDDILDFSKLEAGRLDLESIDVDVGDLVEQVALSMAPAAAARGLSLIAFASPEINWTYTGDPTRLRQILFNLASNAVKFTERGHVRLSAIPRPGDEDGVIFLVSDTGIGMPEQVQERLFTPYGQADSTTSRRFGGTGLGLSICRTLVEIMGGSIIVQSVVGLGTTFTVTVPLPRSEGARQSVPPSDLLAGRRITVVAAVDAEVAPIKAYVAAAGAETAPLAEADVVVVLDPAPAPRTRVPVVRLSMVPQPGMPSRLVRGTLVAAVASALGLESASFAQAASTEVVQRQAPTRDEALAANQLLLIAEDNPINREIVGRQVAGLGYAADMCEDGNAALQRLAETRYRMVLTDIQMPGLDGYGLARAVREREVASSTPDATPRLPIVAMTASHMEGEAQLAMEAGIDEVLIKPLLRKPLADSLERWMGPPAGPSPVAAAKPAATTMAAPATEVATPEPDAPWPVDRSVLADSIGDDDKALTFAFSHFVEAAAEDLDELRAVLAVDPVNPADLRHIAHRIKGTCNLIGATAAADAASALELAAHAGTATTQGPLTECVFSEVERVSEFADKWLSENRDKGGTA